MPDNILSCRPGSYQKFADGMYKHLASIGVKYVEITQPGDIRGELEKLKANGLAVGSMEGDIKLDAHDAIERFKPQVEAAVKLGAKILYLSLHGIEGREEVTYSRIRRLGDLAAAAGLTITLETHPSLITNGEVGLNTMQKVNHPNVRVNWDTANVYYYNQGIDGIAELKKLIKFVRTVHLKETRGKFQTWDFPALGEGIVDFKEVFRLVNEQGVNGPFTIEIEGVEGESLDRAATEARVAASVAHLKKIGCVK